MVTSNSPQQPRRMRAGSKRKQARCQPWSWPCAHPCHAKQAQSIESIKQNQKASSTKHNPAHACLYQPHKTKRARRQGGGERECVCVCMCVRGNGAPDVCPVCNDHHEIECSHHKREVEEGPVVVDTILLVIPSPLALATLHIGAAVLQNQALALVLVRHAQAAQLRRGRCADAAVCNGQERQQRTDNSGCGVGLHARTTRLCQQQNEQAGVGLGERVGGRDNDRGRQTDRQNRKQGQKENTPQASIHGQKQEKMQLPT